MRKTFRRRELQSMRYPFSPSSTRIVRGEFRGKPAMVVHWKMNGKDYALGYDPDRLFGERLRKTRRALIRSVEMTIERAG